MYWSRKSTIRGFTLIEALLALFVTGLCSVLLAMAMQAMADLNRQDLSVQNEMGILQLRQRAALADSAVCEDGQLILVRSQETFSYLFDKGRVVQTPGYEILLENLERGAFYESDGIWLETDAGIWQIR